MTSMNDLLSYIEPILHILLVASPVLLFLGYQVAKLERKSDVLSWKVRLMQFEIEILETKEKYAEARISHLESLVLAMNKYDTGEDYETMVKRLKQEEM